MFAEGIDIWATDSHPVYDENYVLINPSKPIVIENPKKARAMLKKNFKEVTYLSGNEYATKMNEEALLKYGSKNVKNALVLKRAE